MREEIKNHMVLKSNVLQACLEHHVSAVVMVRSDKCYLPSAEPRSENDRLGGYDPYSGSKAALEQVILAYQRSFFGQGQLSSVRAGNVIGGGDWASRRLLPDIMRAVTKNTPLLLRDPSARRPFQYVLEPLWGYAILAACILRGFSLPSCNFGPKKSCSVLDLVHYLQQGCQLSLQYSVEKTSQVESPVLQLNSDLALQKLGWFSKLEWKESLDWTVEDYANLARPGFSAQDTLGVRIAKYARLWE